MRTVVEEVVGEEEVVGGWGRERERESESERIWQEVLDIFPYLSRIS